MHLQNEVELGKVNSMNDQKNITYLFFVAVFAVVTYLVWMMAKIMIGPIIFGMIIAGVSWPLNDWVISKFKLSRTLSALTTSFLIFLFVVVPLALVVVQFSKEALNLYGIIIEGLGQKDVNDFLFRDGFGAIVIKKITSITGSPINMETIQGNLTDWAKMISGSVLKGVNSMVGNFLAFTFDLIIMMIVTFAFLTEGPHLKKYIFELSPLPEQQEQMILNKFNQMNYVTLISNGIGGVIQGILAGFALWLSGIESVILWSVMMIILAFIPLVGISIITIPATVYLLLTGKVITGIIFFVFTTIVSLGVENWFKPKFIGNRIQINSTFILLAIIGGMGVFGMAGIFYGPIIGILFLTFVEIYHDYYKAT